MQNSNIIMCERRLRGRVFACRVRVYPSWAFTTAEPKCGGGVVLSKPNGTPAMKHLLCAALLLASLPLATAAAAQPLDRSNYLYYSYRDHYRAYGIYSLTGGSLPPDEVYIDPCFKWVSTPRGLRKKFVCRS